MAGQLTQEEMDMEAPANAELVPAVEPPIAQSIGDKATQALELGATPDEVRSVVPRMTLEQDRRALENSIAAFENRVKPKNQLLGVAEKYEFTQEVSAVTGGNPTPDDVAAIEQGKTPPSLVVASSNREELLGDVDPAEIIEKPEDIDVTRRLVSDPRFNERIAIMDAIRVGKDSAAAKSIAEMEQASANQRAKAHHIKEARLAQEVSLSRLGTELDTESGEWLPENLVWGKVNWTPHIRKFLNGDLYGVLAEMSPRILVDYYNRTEALIQGGLLPDTFWTRLLGLGLGGQTAKEAMTNLMKLKGQDRVDAIRNVMTIYSESLPPELNTKLNRYLVMEDLFPNDIILDDDAVEKASLFWLQDLVGWLGVVELIPLVGPLARAAGTGVKTILKSSRHMKALQSQNPTLYAKAMQRMFHNMDNSSISQVFGNLSKIDIVEAALPKAAVVAHGILENIPGNILDEAEVTRLTETSEQAIDTANRLTGAGFSVQEQAGVLENVAKELTASHGGRIRPSLSTIAVLDDMSGAEMRVMLGKNDTGGFSSMDEALDYVQDDLAAVDPENLKFFKVNADGTVTEFKPRLKKNKDGRWESADKPDGEYYVQLKQTHLYSVDDAHLFDGLPPVIGTWMGRALGTLNTPSAFAPIEIVSKFTRTYLGEQALVSQLDSLVAPLYKELNVVERRNVNDVMVWAEKFGGDNGRLPTLTEIKEQFRNLSDAELRGFYQARTLQDTLWAVQNAKLRGNWNTRGFKTLAKDEHSPVYHGLPMGVDDAKKVKEVLDPETGQTITLSADEVDELYKAGGQLLRTEIPNQGSRGKLHRVVVARGAWKVENLRKHVLEYIPGYNTRIYADAHFIQRVRKKSIVDGEEEEIVSTMRTASTRREAETFRKRVIDSLGYRLYKDKWVKGASMAHKEKLLADKGYEIRVSDDARLSDKDRIAIDLSKMQVEGRLFFDNRLRRPIRNVDNKEAEVVDPINSMQRVARMASRQVATEDVIAVMKTRFFDQYAAKLGINTKRTSSEIDADLTDAINSKEKDLSEMAAGARALWRYIRFMEGSMVQSNTAFRRAAIQASEWFDYSVGRRLGARSITKALSRRAHDMSPVDMAKKLAFLHFITARPVRQFILQGSQHFALQAIDPSYIGKWQLDTFSLLSAMRRLARTREGDALFTLKGHTSRTMLGRSKEEMERLISEFNASGLLDGVDVHSYAGGQPKSSTVSPANKLAQYGQGIINTVNKPFNVMRHLGFDMGEQFNVTASYLLALRRVMKENKLKKFTDLDADQWQQVATRGSQYALAMHKANPASWQYGFLSLPMQFLQFTHKWTLMSLNAIPGARKLGLGNQFFTTAESQRIVLAQMLMWGGAGFGIKELVRDFLDRPEIAENIEPEARDILLSGTVDYLLDTMMRKLMDDPELSFAWDEMLAPSMGAAQLAERIMELATEPHLPIEIIMGPSGEVASRFMKAAQFGAALSGKGYEHWTPTQKAQGIIEAAAAGLLASYSDYLKIRMASRMGQWTNQQGVPLGLEAKWEELVLKGALGINPEKVLDYWRTATGLRELSESVRNDAYNHANMASVIALKWGRGEFDDDQALNMFRTMAVVYEEYKEAGQGELFYDEYMKAFKSLRTPDGEALPKAIAAKLMRGYTGDPIADAVNSKLLTPAQKELLEPLYQQALKNLEPAHEDRLKMFEFEEPRIKEMTNNGS